MNKQDMDDESHDRAIGMDNSIGRHDFLQGAAITVAVTAGDIVPELVLGAESETAGAAQDQPGYYPPTHRDFR